MAPPTNAINTTPTTPCSTCGKQQQTLPAPLKRCGQCKQTLYCSRECQVSAWAGHKAECATVRAGGAGRTGTSGAPAATGSSGGATGSSTSTSTSPNPPSAQLADTATKMLAEMGITDQRTIDEIMATVSGTKKPTNLSPKNQALFAATGSSNDFLSALPEAEAMRQLIDCFRMRCEDEYSFNGVLWGLYNSEDPTDEFKKFLKKAEKAKVLPAWWSPEKRAKVMEMAQDRKGKACIHFAVGKPDIQEAYGDNMMPMKLRMLAETIYGSGVMRG